MDFQKYNIKEQKKKKEKKRKKEKQTNKNKARRIIKTTTTTSKRVYMPFALKIGSFFFLKSNSRL